MGVASTPIMKSVFTEAIGREVWLREDTSDEQVWSDTFTGLYHLPPKEMPTPTLVLDLGANIGLTAAHYCVMWPKADVVGYEMDYNNCDVATVNVPKALILPQAIAGEPGFVSYNQNLRAEAFTYVYGGDSRVKAVTLLQAIEDVWGQDAKVDFVKMDIEGAEWDVIEDGTWVNSVRHLVIELHEPGRAGVLDDSQAMVQEAITRLNALGLYARHHPPHPRAVYARCVWL